MEPLFFDTGASVPGSQPAPSIVNVHPVVLFSILDQHLRRDPNQDRVIGQSPLCGGGGRNTATSAHSSEIA